MEIDLTGLSQSWAKLAETIGLDPAALGIAIGGLALLIVYRVIRRKGEPEDGIAITRVEEAVDANAPPPARQQSRPEGRIDLRFEALRLQTEELNSATPPRRHFNAGEKPSPKYNIRRRRTTLNDVVTQP